MKPKLLGLTILAVLVSSLFPQPAHALPDSGSVRLTVSVFDDAAVPPAVLSVAQDRAALIMHRAGISVAWIDCGTPGHRPPNAGCSAISFPQHLSVRLVSHASLTAEDIFGQSFQDARGEGNYAVVYFRTLQSSKAAKRLNSGELLGHVVAHELGHLLLGLHSHSATGLMSAMWQATELLQASQGNLFFTAEEGGLIRSRYLMASARFGKAPERQQASPGN